MSKGLRGQYEIYADLYKRIAEEEANKTYNNLSTKLFPFKIAECVVKGDSECEMHYFVFGKDVEIDEHSLYLNSDVIASIVAKKFESDNLRCSYARSHTSNRSDSNSSLLSCKLTLPYDNISFG